ncbi:MAG: reprolysin-like metallopeptidase, partial [Bacteroidota bacterium]
CVARINSQVVKTNILHPELAQKLPQVATFSGSDPFDSRWQAKLDWTNQGFHAIIFSPNGTYYIDPESKNDQTYYIAYSRKDLKQKRAGEALSCLGEAKLDKAREVEFGQKFKRDLSKKGYAARSSGGQLRTYRLAVAANGEYTNFHDDGNSSNGTAIEDAQNAIITSINRINGIFERELTISFILVDNESIIFEDPSTDPFSVGVEDIIDESQVVIDNNIGSANYDIGHTFVVSTSGLAILGGACRDGLKARGVSGTNSPEGDTFDVDFVAHELGHQLGANHTFNGTQSSCIQRSSLTAYEPGSGSTIMAYAGICGNDNIQQNSDDYFHGASFDQIISFVEESFGSSCPALTNTGNQIPVVDAGEGGFNIPISTPFVLEGSAMDADAGDVLTYCWEQLDRGPAGSPNLPEGNAPLFRSFPPVSSPSRTFPQLSDIINNTATFGEILPDYSRDLTFQLTVRDNQMAGGINTDEISFNVTDEAGPFRVTAPNFITLWEAGSIQQINWDVANTNGVLVNCQSVNILLSTDGGLTYPQVLATDIPNVGSHRIIVPNLGGGQNRIKVEAADNIFFDISDENFSIQPAAEADFAFIANPAVASVCAPDSVVLEIEVASILSFADPVTLDLVDLPSGLEATFGDSTLNPGESTQLIIKNTQALGDGTFDFFIQASSGGTSKTQSIVLNIGTQTAQASLVAPANLATEVGLVPILDWAKIPNALNYDLQIALDSDFNQIVTSVGNIERSEFVLTTALLINQTYFWRVRANSSCGTGIFSDVFSFTTLNCNNTQEYNAQNLPIAIPDAGSVQSVIQIPDNLVISSLRVINLRGEHTFIRDLTMSLTGPSGDNAILFQNICFDQDDFNLDLDDAATVRVEDRCPPNDGGTYRPQTSLGSVFGGRSSQGNWTLEIRDDAEEDTGDLLAWGLGICASTNQIPMVQNNAGILDIPGSSSYGIDQTMLSATDDQDGAASITYIIKRTPVSGQLRINGQILGLDASFTQSELNNGAITFSPDNPDDIIIDFFSFVLQDSQGGRSASTDFTISLSPTNPIEPQELIEGIRISPNPGPGKFDLSFDFAGRGEIQLMLMSIEGKVLMKKNVSKEGLLLATELDLENQSAGVYLLRITSERGSTTRKILKY